MPNCNYGAYKKGWGNARIEEMEAQLEHYVILQYEYLVCQEWARIRRDCEVKGRSMEAEDIWIAACARRFGCPLATNNARHFRNVEDLVVISAEGS